MDDNPYKSPSVAVEDPTRRIWKGGAEATLIKSGLLHRRVLVHRPIEATIEYFARGVRDRILLDGHTVVSRLPILWLHSRFDFSIPCADGDLPATVRVKLRRGLRMARFEITINNVVVYEEEDGYPVLT